MTWQTYYLALLNNKLRVIVSLTSLIMENVKHMQK